jgi:Leucine-rich repeat (LRR) protein
MCGAGLCPGQILTSNQLDELPSSIGDLTRVRKLMLSNNRLTTLPPAMARVRMCARPRPRPRSRPRPRPRLLPIRASHTNLICTVWVGCAAALLLLLLLLLLLHIIVSRSYLTRSWWCMAVLARCGRSSCCASPTTA